MSVDLVVVGLGYVGLPLAQQALRKGATVIGFDIAEDVVRSLNSGRSHVDDLSDSDVASMVAGGFRASSDESVFSAAAAIVVCVPTPLAKDQGPDLGAVIAATESIARNLRSGTLVVLESTTYPGTTDEVVRPILEARSGLVAGTDFNLAFSPERIDPGNTTYGIQNTPKVVGGFTPACTERARALYAGFVDTVVLASGMREAETAKLLENTYRHVNIALVNEMAQLCHELDIDLWDVIRLASTKPFGFQAFYPGPGVGGHCIPIDPNYLSHRVRSELGYPFRFVELAQEINRSMPAYVARRAQEILNVDRLAVNGAKILILGVTYKPDIADERESPAVPLAVELQRLGAQVSFHDPYVRTWSVAGTNWVDIDDVGTGANDALAAFDLVILVQHHHGYDLPALSQRATRLFDTRGASNGSDAIRL